MSTRPQFLVDIGSTVIKACLVTELGSFGPVSRVAREPGVAPGDQALELFSRMRRRKPDLSLRVCSSANSGVRVGLLGLSARYSLAAAGQAVVSAGGNVVYAHTMPSPVDAPLADVDVLVLSGGVDGADHTRLLAALDKVRLENFPHQVLVWAGAADLADGVLRWKPRHSVANVLDTRLRMDADQLTETIRQIYVSDLADHKGLTSLAGHTAAPIWPTPAVLTLAATRMATRQDAPVPPTPFVIIDAGGATTDVHFCADLKRAGAAGLTPAQSVQRKVFTDLGVVSSSRALLERTSNDTHLQELIDAIAPANPRALYQQIRDGDPSALEPPIGFLACLFNAVRAISEEIDLSRAAAIVITGGAWLGTHQSVIRAVIGAGCSNPDGRRRLFVDHHYDLWARGLVATPANSGEETRCLTQA